MWNDAIHLPHYLELEPLEEIAVPVMPYETNSAEDPEFPVPALPVPAFGA
jgi:hypothetical protein